MTGISDLFVDLKERLLDSGLSEEDYDEALEFLAYIEEEDDE